MDRFRLDSGVMCAVQQPTAARSQARAAAVGLFRNTWQGSEAFCDRGTRCSTQRNRQQNHIKISDTHIRTQVQDNTSKGDQNVTETR